MRAIRVHRHGGPEALTLETLNSPDPAPGQILVRMEAAGINFIDVYQRSGLYPVQTPFTLGQEGAGIVERVGAGVSAPAVGERVAWSGPMGAYAEYAVVPADRVVRVPDGVSGAQAAAVMLQGMTAHYLVCTTYPLGPDDTCLVHAAAGGVGQLLCQMARMRGARVIGTVGDDAKAALAREAGAHEVINYRATENLAHEVRQLTGGRGVQVVYDGVGQATFEASLASLAPRGMMVTFGNASGPVPAFEPLKLSQKGSLFLTRPKLQDYIAQRAELERRAGEVLGWVRDGKLVLRIWKTYPLAAAADAHRALESRATTGKLLLLPAA
jgi:NADPH2:quinone reductase